MQNHNGAAGEGDPESGYLIFSADAGSSKRRPTISGRRLNGTHVCGEGAAHSSCLRRAHQPLAVVLSWRYTNAVVIVFISLVLFLTYRPSLFLITDQVLAPRRDVITVNGCDASNSLSYLAWVITISLMGLISFLGWNVTTIRQPCLSTGTSSSRFQSNKNGATGDSVHRVAQDSLYQTQVNQQPHGRVSNFY